MSKKNLEKNIYEQLAGTNRKNKIEQLIDEFKQIVFSVLFVLLKEESNSGLIYFVLMGAFDYA